jgi:hypothetical protein
MWNYNPDTNVIGGPDGVEYWAAYGIDTDPCCPVIEGCTDPAALNHPGLTATNHITNIACTATTEDCCNDIDANTDDGSCCYVDGCMEQGYYNTSGTNGFPEACIQLNAVCIDFVYGCMDSTQYNYNPDANTNTDCEAVVYGCTNEDFDSQIGDDGGQYYNVNANTEVGNGSCAFVGCLDEFDGDGLPNVNWVCNVAPNLCVDGEPITIL